MLFDGYTVLYLCKLTHWRQLNKTNTWAQTSGYRKRGRGLSVGLVCHKTWGPVRALTLKRSDKT